MPLFLIQGSYSPDGLKGLLKEGGTGVREVVRCHVWLRQMKGATTDRGLTVRLPCSALLPG